MAGRGQEESRAAARRARGLRALLVGWLLLVGVLAPAAFARPADTSGAAAAAETNKPPKVLKNPVSVSVEAGQSASFNATASGTPTPTEQWERSTDGGTTWAAIEGASAATFTIASASPAENGYQFRALFKNAAGEATSKTATLTVKFAPAIVQQPQSVTVEEGQNASFEATASASPAATVKWETSANGGTTWTLVAGATSNKLTITAPTTSLNGHEYRATFKNSLGEASSEAATLTVQKAPAVTKEPADSSRNEGQEAVFEATASGFPAPTVQWERSTDGGASWIPIEGATANRFAIAGVVLSESGNEFRATFQNAAGTARSRAATLTVHSPPVITEQPSNTIVAVGETATFETAASGTPAPTVQWEASSDGGKTWSPVAGATADQLIVENAQLSQNGTRYRAAFTNTYGTTLTGSATLTVATNRYSAVAWGENVYGQLGDGSNELSSDVPVPVSDLKFVTAVAAGGRHSIALRADGTVVAWGANGLGQLGDGNTTESNVPVQVKGLVGVKAIAAGGYHSLALLNNGTVMAWGDNENGQLGNGSSGETVDTPEPVHGVFGVKAIAAGTSYSLALLNNGTVMAWGANESGQLGDGAFASTDLPVAAKKLSNVTAIAAGGEFGLALLSSGAVDAWGNDELGQLADGLTGENSSTPAQIASLSGVSAIAAGTTHALALEGNGSVMAWGTNGAGELGDGKTSAPEHEPVAVGGLSGVSAISAGDETSAALLASGSVMTWGTDVSGVLGNGVSHGSSDVPVTVLGLAKASSISAGRSHMLAFGEPIPTVTSLSSQLGPAGGGGTIEIKGTDLAGATSVKFGSTEASSFTVESSTSISATIPPGSGTVDVTVATPSGISPPVSEDRYTYVAPPTVKKLSKKSGPAAGGTTVVITGTEFVDVSAVRFGTVEASSFTVNSPTTITATSPSSIGGTVDVTVTNALATSAASLADHFKFVPAVIGLAPSNGPAAGGTSVTVSGSGFAEGTTATTFKFGKVKAKSVNCTSSTSCTVIAPAQPVGTIQVVATVGKANSLLSPPGDQFTYE